MPSRLMLNGYGLADPGSGAKVIKQNPLTNVFAQNRCVPACEYTRLVLRHNYAGADNTNFGRSASTPSSRTSTYIQLLQLQLQDPFTVAEFLTNIPTAFSTSCC